MFQDRKAFTALVGTNGYVKALQYSSALQLSAPTAFSLGSPVVSSASLIASALDAHVAATTSYAYTVAATYGRNVIITPSADPGAVGGTFDVYGFDYLNQPMIERFAGANGATAVLYGQKAFKKVTAVKIVTATTNASTLGIGLGTRLGLPYKGDVVWAKEGGAYVRTYKDGITLGADWDAAACVAGGSKFVKAPTPGYIKTLRGLPSGGGSTTDAATTVKIGGTAIVGLTVTEDQNATTEITDTPTTVGYNANNRFKAGDLIELVHAATTSGGPFRTEIDIVPTQVLRADLTDPATNVTGDPRGTYESLAVLDGATEIIVGLVCDNAVNASNNGGLHGIQHYYA